MNSKDNRMVSRLTQRMVAVVYADVTSTRGLRNVMDGETELVEGFQFNVNAPLATTFFAPYAASINRVTGVLKIDIPSFIPANMVTAPSGTTHYKLISGGGSIDFETGVFVVDAQASAVLPWNGIATAILALSNTVALASIHPLFLLFGIEFYQEVNGLQYALKNGAYNALSVIKVSGM